MGACSTGPECEGAVGVAENKCGEAERQDGMIERGAEILPEGGTRPGGVRRKKHREHQEEPPDAGIACQDAKDEAEADREFTVGNEIGEKLSVREDEVLQHRHHEWIRAIRNETADPFLEIAALREFRPKNFVFTKHQEENADGDAQHGEDIVVSVSR